MKKCLVQLAQMLLVCTDLGNTSFKNILDCTDKKKQAINI